ncbi:MAG: hypothetical protein DME30_00210 [Verrucomicrobia bacterium]|nr:MAG: hypothetical protein DME30_00210 [Verrucomicrobiota bacterium]
MQEIFCEREDVYKQRVHTLSTRERKIKIYFACVSLTPAFKPVWRRSLHVDKPFKRLLPPNPRG